MSENDSAFAEVLVWPQALRAHAEPRPSSEGNSERGTSRCIVHRMRQAGINLVVFFGSQTGNSQQLAEQLTKEGRNRFGLEAMAADLADFDYETLSTFAKENVAVFVLSSYGEGEPTDNALGFFDFMTQDPIFSDSDRLDCPLQDMTYAAFGLGNSTYEHYNAVVRKVDSALQSLGANRLTYVGEGDDAQGTAEDSFISWKDALWQSLRELQGLEEREASFEPSLVVTPYPPDTPGRSEKDTTVLELSKVQNDPTGTQKWAFVQVAKSQELFNSPSRHCTHLELDTRGTGISYETGDHVSIWPVNADAEIERFLRVFGLLEQRHTRFKISAAQSTARIPIIATTTYDTAARHLLDIAGPVSRQALNILAQFSTEETQKLSLVRLAHESAHFHHVASSQLLNLAQLVEAISPTSKSLPVPFAVLLECVKPLQPRYYSISSSSLVQKDTVSVTVVADTVELADRQFHGVASNFLLALKKHQHEEQTAPGEITYDLAKYKRDFGIGLPIHIRQSTFRLPSDASNPIIMIGPGTGVAPFRAFVQERSAQMQAGVPVGKSVLFYGCRKQSEDFVYGTEWQDAHEILGDNFEMYTAFSRQTSEKAYVQHLLAKHASKILPLLLDQRAYLYICGDSRMAREVQHTLQELIGSLSRVDGELFLHNLKDSGRFQEDVW
ncbi:NADPH cytochrome P450 oxidoreductase [Dactylonectria estremocensis]|uniref:NADPH--cytochrome P450 reductase n=1 Tax=Dactylonectria estremocensis TaxID=1079267 RepID=A0A9P9IRD4_9HYPO|nr:NADPH cytochrome P450 oxidoreductase [Dactylonectria estremocensis]